MSRVLVLLALSSCALACDPTDLGSCDIEAAQALVYDVNGLPAYEGQAYIIETCGSGSFCHAEDIEPELRFGASRGLAFDLQLAGSDEASRLDSSQRETHLRRHSVYDFITSGAMPPPTSEAACTGTAVDGAPELCGFSLGAGYERIADGETSGTPLPSIRSAEAQNIMRNWLACGAPVVERTSVRGDGNENSVGDTQPAIDRPFVDDTWGSIYAGLIAPSCARGQCHDAAAAAGNLDLSSAATAHAQLMLPAAGRFCGGGLGAVRVVPNDPANSLLIHKLRGVGPGGELLCGEAMPNGSTSVSEIRIVSIEAWIMAGALL